MCKLYLQLLSDIIPIFTIAHYIRLHVYPDVFHQCMGNG